MLHPLQFVLASIAIILLPGPGQLAILTASLSGGFRAALRAVAGLLTGDVTIMILVAIGTDVILRDHPGWLSVLKALGGLYICWLGLRVFLSDLVALVEVHAAGAAPNWYLRTLGITLLNPKAILFFASFFPLFADPARGIANSYLSMGALFSLLSGSYLLFFAAAGSRLSDVLRKPSAARRWTPRFLGTAIAGFGGWMVLG